MPERSPRSWRTRYVMLLAAGILVLFGITVDAIRHGVTLVDIGAGIAALFLVCLGIQGAINIRKQGRP